MGLHVSTTQSVPFCCYMVGSTVPQLHKATDVRPHCRSCDTKYLFVFFYIYSCQESAVLFLSALGLDWCYYIALSTSSHYYSNYIRLCCLRSSCLFVLFTLVHFKRQSKLTNGYKATKASSFSHKEKLLLLVCFMSGSLFWNTSNAHYI